MDYLFSKFNSYFTFTESLKRDIPLASGGYLYPHDSIIADVSFLAALLSELYELTKDDFDTFYNTYKKAFVELEKIVYKFWKEDANGNK